MIIWEYDNGFTWPASLDEDKVNQWLLQCLRQHSRTDGLISINLVNKAVMKQINMETFGRDYDTDTITLAYSRPGDTEVSADIYISYPQVEENARNLDVSYTEELLRVLIHSVLHAMGMDDGTPEQKARMRKEEDVCLSRFS